MQIPRRVFWYEAEMDRIAKKINFMMAMSSITSDKKELQKRIEKLRKYHAILCGAHMRSMRTVLKGGQ